ncbi:MAG: VacJ family lipoprotein [Parvularculaceae bacterium]
MIKLGIGQLAAVVLAFGAGLGAASGAFAQSAASSDDGVAQSDIDNAVSGDSVQGTPDPWEGFNRKMFRTNIFIDRYFFTPAAKTYRATTPKVGRRSLRRFFRNLRTPGVFVNDILQGEFGRAGQTLSRFVINSTIGAGGFADPAAELGVPYHGEDFGQTLAVWGVDSGPYLVLPLLGPSTVRDGFGSGVQIAFNPLVYVRTDPARIANYSISGVSGIATREQFLDPLAEIEAKSLDYYASLRSFYLQARKREIANGKTDYSDLPDIGEYEEFDDIN